MAYHGSVQVPPYKLVYGHEAVLPWETTIGSRRIDLQDSLTADECYNLMADATEDLVQSRLRALAKVTKNKERVARHYNKKVVPKSFTEGELVWKFILPIGTRDNNSTSGHQVGKDRFKYIRLCPKELICCKDLMVRFVDEHLMENT
jgi:hypothetical protein